jgi:hypothetical protein
MAPVPRVAVVVVASVLVAVRPARAEEKGAPPAVQRTAALGEGVTVRSKDDTFSVTLRARFQPRFEFIAEDGKESETRFMVRRARLLLQGHALSPKLTYYLQLGFSNLDTEADLRLPLRDAYVSWTPLRDIGVRGGQMKVPFGRQRVTSSSALEMVDRAILIGELSLDRDVGVVLFSRDFLGLGERLGYQLGVWGGDGRNRVAEHEGALWSARLDFWPNGHFADLSEGDLTRSPRPRVAVGLSLAFNQNTYRHRSTIGDTYRLGGFDYLHGALDAMVQWRGFSAQVEALVRNADRDSRTGTVDGETVTEFSRSAGRLFVQASQMLTQNLQIAGRYGHMAPLRRTDPALRAQDELGGAVSFYFVEHALKLQADYFWLFGPESGAGRHQVRVQAQLYF